MAGEQAREQAAEQAGGRAGERAGVCASSTVSFAITTKAKACQERAAAAALFLMSNTDQAGELWFYHLERSSVEDVLPELVEKTISRGWRALIKSTDREQRYDECQVTLVV